MLRKREFKAAFWRRSRRGSIIEAEKYTKGCA